MTQQEFESRTGMSVEQSLFPDIHDIYMACGYGMDKDEFCHLWVRKDFRTLLGMAAKESRLLCESYDKVSASLAEFREKDAYMKSDIASALLSAASKYHDTALYEKAVSLVGIRDVVLLKIEHRLPLCDSDREYIKNNIK